MYSRFSLLLFLLIFLGACAQTELIVHTAKKIIKDGPKPKKKGSYKVGNPYKIKGVWYYPAVDYNYDRTGVASWYGPGFNGKLTANGETYDQNALTAAHKTLPMPSIVQVTNLENGRSIKVTVNDRGPYAFGRIIDMSRRGAQLLGFHRKGTARVRVQVLSKQSRMIAHNLKNGEALARIGTPIHQNTNVGKPQVASKALAPPPGIKSTKVDIKYIPRKMAYDIPKPPSIGASNSAVEVTNKPVFTTNMYVQAGAFTRYDYANRTAARLTELGNVKVTSVKIRGKEFFRVRAGPINVLENADKILERVIRAGFNNARIVVD